MTTIQEDIKLIKTVYQRGQYASALRHLVRYAEKQEETINALRRTPGDCLGIMDTYTHGYNEALDDILEALKGIK